MSIDATIDELVRAAVRAELEPLRAEIAKLREAAAAPAQRLTTEQLAQLWQVSEAHVRNLRKRGLPCCPVGESPRFVLADCEAWLRDEAAPQTLRSTRGAA